MKNNFKISIIGLGYVGLPLAIEFGKFFETIGFDISKTKIEELKNFNDREDVVSPNMFRKAKKLRFTYNERELNNTDIFIVAVPTPIDENKKPDLTMLKKASKIIGGIIKKQSIVVYESTIYPGATEEVCIPILEKQSRLKWKRDFFVGYSPERINPGDKKHQIKNIVKIVSGDTNKTLKTLIKLYEKIIEAGVCPVSSIKVAEAAKIIENTQRDINIALMNELSIIFDKLNLDTMEIIEAASTKWNFIPFKPGFVGGHCIGVDPYYLTYKSEKVGYKPQMILAGRKINDNMATLVARKLLELLKLYNMDLKKIKINILGLTFKENVKDLRNSKVVDLLLELKKINQNIYVHDPLIDNKIVDEIGMINRQWNDMPKSDVLIIAVPHDQILKLGYKKILEKLKNNGILMDIKSVMPNKKLLGENVKIWRL